MMCQAFIQKSCFLFLLLSLFPLNLLSQQDQAFTLQNKANLSIELDTLIHVHTELNPFHSQTTITGLAFSGEIALFSDSSLVRMILMDDHYNEYLIYEAYPILSGSGQFSVFEAAEETSLLNNITPDRVTLELINASVHIKEFTISEEGTYQSNTKSARLLQLTLNKIELINQNIEKAGQTWLAGETSISRLSYQEKKSMFGGCVPNFQGFEYYIGGVFVLPGAKGKNPVAKGTPMENLSQQKSQYPDEFSWQNRHGINWVSPVKNQGPCGSCAAFGTVATVELLINQYYNQILNYDLSEQQILSCKGTCEHGINTIIALDYIKNTGIVQEGCFPYTASDSECSDICSDPSERISIDNWDWANSDKEDKKRVIIQGATAGHIVPWEHIVQVVGYHTLEAGDILDMKNDYDSIVRIYIDEENPLVGETAWIIKNSWGTDWGTDGFGYVTGNGSALILYALLGPLSSPVFNGSDISCTDNDGDGFYCWGIGPKPSHCPECHDQADGDDSNPCIGPMDEYGNLLYLTPTPEAKDTIILYSNSPDLHVEGSNIRWYTDRKLQDLVHTGNLFPTGHKEAGKYTYYVTQTISGCASDAKNITLSLVSSIPPPAGLDTTIDIGESGVLSVEGEEGAVFKWYADPSLTNLLATGGTYLTEIREEGDYTYYVTQTVCLIESAADTVKLKVTDLVNILDNRFREGLIMNGVDQNRDKAISLAEAETVDSLRVSFLGIRDMSGIETFVNLKFLDCSHNPLGSLDVSANLALEKLYCPDNQLNDLDVSANLVLKYLDCHRNGLDSLDVSANPALESLDCHMNELASLNVLANPTLKFLDCHMNGLDSLDVSANPALESLDCHMNELASLNVLANPTLKFLDCHKNQLHELDVSANPALESLDCHENRLSKMNVSANPALEFLDCHKNELSSLEVSNNPALTELFCQENQFTLLDVSNNPALTELNCYGNDITSLDVSNNPALTELYCYENEITSLDVSNNPALTELHCYENEITSLDVSGCTALYRLYCNENQLSSLDVSGCTALSRFYCNENQLSSLDVSGCSALYIMYCNDNQLTSLDVSDCTALYRLYCNKNQLSSLDVSGSPSLNKLECFENQLSSLDVSACTKVRHLICSSNRLSNLDLSALAVTHTLRCSDNLLISLNLCNISNVRILEIANMPTLQSVFISSSTFAYGLNADTIGSPNVKFNYCGVGTDENISTDFSIYPNPVNDLLNVDANLPGNYIIVITALNGHELHRKETDGPDHQIDLSNFDKGIYLITIRSKDYVTTRKIIKL